MYSVMVLDLLVLWYICACLGTASMEWQMGPEGLSSKFYLCISSYLLIESEYIIRKCSMLNQRIHFSGQQLGSRDYWSLLP